MDRGRQLFSKIREQVSGWIVTGIMPRNARRRRFIEFPSGLAANTTPHAQGKPVVRLHQRTDIALFFR
jgi:hypothetical protein